ncbi:MAG: acyl carrier protein [Clostridia bacterium]|nr:acyl carrier protein [Clostridia bacterium]
MVFEKVKAILADQFDVEEDSITMETHIQEDLGADSLDVMELMMTLGDEFDMQVDESEVENLTTVGALVKFIEANA